jgi:hypothetical protein
MIEVKVSYRIRNTYDKSGISVPWAWCVEYLGPPEPRGTRWAWDTNRTFWFHDSADAAWFSLLFVGE